MFKLMIADDNPYVLQELSECTDWENFDFQLIGTYEDGMELLNAAKKDTPDLVITDISMPVMGGVQLATHLNQLNPSIKIVFISSFSEFEYARVALKLGVFDYILKPIVHSQLMDVCTRVLDSLQQEQTMFFERMAEQEKRKYFQNAALSHYISRLLFYAEEETAILSELEHLGLVIEKNTNIYIVCFSLENLEQLPPENHSHQYLHSILSYGQNDAQILPIMQEKNTGTFLLMYQSKTLPISDLLSGLCVDIETKMNLRITMGYSNTSQRVNDLPELYRQAKTTLERLLKCSFAVPFASYDDINTDPNVQNNAPSTASKSFSKHVTIMRRFIEQQYMNPITTNDVASSAFLSPSYANHIFSSECHITIFSYITECRINNAKKLLLETDEQILRIAELVGYSTRTSFYLAFKRYTGTSPTEYRQQS